MCLILIAFILLLIWGFGRYATGPSHVATRRSTAQQDIAAIGVALDAFDKDTGRYPTEAEGLGVLAVPPTGLAGWQGPYLRKIPTRDPWGNSYVYHGDRPDGYLLLSVGPDRTEGTRDDIRSR